MWSVKWILFCSSAISNINKKEKLAILSSNDVRCLTAPPLDPHWKLADISFTEENLAAASSAVSKFKRNFRSSSSIGFKFSWSVQGPCSHSVYWIFQAKQNRIIWRIYMHGFKVKIWGIRSIFLTWGLPLDRLRSFEGKNHPFQEKKMLKLISEFTTNIEAFKQPKKSPSASFFFQLYSNHKNFFNQTTQVTLATRKPNASRIIKA